MYVYGTCLFYGCCSDSVGVCGNVCCAAAVVKDTSFLFNFEVLKYDITSSSSHHVTKTTRQDKTRHDKT